MTRVVFTVLAVALSACSFTSQTPVPTGWQPGTDEALRCDDHGRWVVLDALLAAPAFTFGATDLLAGDDGRPTNYALLTLGALHVASAVWGLRVRGRCKRAKVADRESAVSSLRQSELWWTRASPCPGDATLARHDNDTVRCELAGGRPHGPAVEFAYGSDTQRRNEYHYRNGVRHGPFRIWHNETGQLEQQGEYRDGAMMLGRLRRWDDAGRAIEPDYGTSAVTRWVGDVKLEEGAYVDGVPDGEWTIWNERGERVEDGAYVDGSRVGVWTTWHNGVAREAAQYYGGVKHGAFTRWGPGGKTTELGEYWYAKPHGFWQYFDDTGDAVIMEGSFDQGERHGEWTYFEAGVVIERGSYARGLREGVWKRWDTAGTLIDQREYRQGQLVGQAPPPVPSGP